MKRTPARILTSLAFGAAVFSIAWAASAEESTLLPPDILLLIDTSGSMGLTTVRDDSDPTKYAPPQCATYPASTPVDVNATSFATATPAGATPPDRWSILVKVLTGTVEGHSCSSQPRAQAEFKSEFGLGTTSPAANTVPYDAGYYLPYNRIVATNGTEFCTPAPSWDPDIRQQLLDNAVKWPTNSGGGPIYWRDMADDFKTMPYCSFPTQDADGLIDLNQQSARFGIMTFDPQPHWLTSTTKTIGTGVVTGSNPPQASYPGGVGDTWSYFPNWRTDPSTGYGVGWPGGCNEQASALIEVGARNPAAPPWEGRLIDFGDPTAGTDEIMRNNDRVQQALLSVRPYGATPIAAMLEDARYFLLQDTTELKEGSNGYFWGGAVDDSAKDAGRCRKRYVILITDGGPNLDLRPDCAYNINNVPGQCPYPTPEESVQALANVGIPTYVVGFSLTTASGTNSCTQLLQGTDPCGALASCSSVACTSGQCAYGYCINDPDQETLAACCTIKGIADVGGTTARFADNEASLKAELTDIINQTDKVTQTDTLPVFASGSALYTPNQDGFAAAEFLTSFTPAPYSMLEGNLSRKRYVCEPVTNGPPEPELKDMDPLVGDSYDDNIDLFKAERNVFTVVAELTTDSKILSDRTVRPWYNESTGDGLGKVGISAGSSTTKMVTGAASGFATSVDAKALLGSSTCTTNCCFRTPTDAAPTSTTCRTRFLNMQLGLPSGDPDINADIRTSAFAAIVKATPILAGPPDDYLRDESYLYFQNIMRTREAVLYTPTVDGQLHAFGITRLTNELNELWTFMPPAVLPRIGSQFPDRYASTTRMLLDGPIVVRDVAGKVDPGESGRFLQRTKADAKNPSPTTTRWHTILLGAFGSSPGYYAMDVTWPDPDKTAPAGYTAGPRFLWQLTTDADGHPLFGNRAAPPTITTLFFKMPGDLTVAEHAVAILPGGYGGERSNTLDNVTFDPGEVDSVDDRLTVRPQTNDYSPSTGTADDILTLAGARSLTIVRLDTGEVVRTFRHGVKGAAPVAADQQAPAGLYAQGRITNAPFDAPMVGHVIAYPNGAGAVSDRAYAGDAEGRLWRVDLSSAEPGDWSVDLFHDAYPAAGLDFTAHGTGPIETPPILSTDPVGRVTIAISTGDQRTLTETGEYNVWSLTEIRDGSTAKARVNWYLSSDNAKNPDGTPTLAPLYPKTDDPTYVEEANHFDHGERVTGPMMLFDSVLYFTTYSPEDAACTPGWTHLWAAHYINPKVDNSPKDGPAPYMEKDPPADGSTTGPTGDPKILLRPIASGASFGPGITAKPACYTTEVVDGDPFMGFGTHTSVSSVTPTQYQLVLQGTGTGTDTPTNVFRQNLYPPLGGGRIDSWASILD